MQHIHDDTRDDGHIQQEHHSPPSLYIPISQLAASLSQPLSISLFSDSSPPLSKPSPIEQAEQQNIQENNIGNNNNNNNIQLSHPPYYFETFSSTSMSLYADPSVLFSNNIQQNVENTQVCSPKNNNLAYFETSSFSFISSCSSPLSAIPLSLSSGNNMPKPCSSSNNDNNDEKDIDSMFENFFHMDKLINFEPFIHNS